MYSKLELEVMKDMIDNGFDPSNKEHINKYWGERL